MPITKIKLKDGRFYDIMVPEGATPELIKKYVLANKDKIISSGVVKPDIKPREAQNTQADILGLPNQSVSKEQTEQTSGFMDTVKNISSVLPALEATGQVVTGGLGAVGGGLAGLGTLALQEGKEFFGGKNEPIDTTLARAGENLGKVSSALTYQPITKGGQQLSGTAAYPFEKLAQGANFVAEPIAKAGYPNIASVVDTSIQALPLALGSTKVRSKIVNTGKAFGRVADKVQSGVKSLNESSLGDIVSRDSIAQLQAKSKKIVTSAVNKAVKPTYPKKQTTKQVASHDNKAYTVVEDIVENKRKVAEYSPSGKKIVDLPETMEDFQVSIDTALPKIYKEYTDIINEVDSYIPEWRQQFPINKFAKKDHPTSPVKISAKPVIDSLDKIIDSGKFNEFSKSTLDYVLELKDRFSKKESANGFTAMEVQDKIQVANNSAKAYYNNPSNATYGRAMVDAQAANALREGLHKMISDVDNLMVRDGKKISPDLKRRYTENKRLYGAYKNMQDSVGRAANKLRNRPGGFNPNFTDILSAHHIIKGIARFDATQLAAGAAGEAFSIYNKRAKNPNRVVKKMFKKVNENLEKGAKQ